MCAELVANVDVHAEGYEGKTVSVVLHQEGCPERHEPAEVVVTPMEPHEHDH